MKFFGSRRSQGSKGKRVARRDNRRISGLLGRSLVFEPLETRHMLSVTLSPITGYDPGGVFDVPGGKTLYVPLTGTDAGQTISYTATSSDPNVHVTVLNGNPTLVLNVSGTTVTSRAQDGTELATAPFSGTMTIELFPGLAPNMVNQIEALVNSGYYNNRTFYRIVPGFVIQGGFSPTADPTQASITQEFNANIAFNSPGLMAMANTGVNSKNSTEFFIADIGLPLNGNPLNLNFDYTIFGQLTSGFDIYNDVMNASGVTSNDSSPTAPVKINTATIINDTQNGVLQITAPNNFTGNSTIQVTAHATDNTTANQSFGVTFITPTPQPYPSEPIALSPVNNLITGVNQPVSFQVTAADYYTTVTTAPDIAITDAGSFSWAPYTNPAHVNVTVVPGTGNTATVTLTPTAGFTGTMNLVAHADIILNNGSQNFFFKDTQSFTLTVVGPINITAPSQQLVQLNTPVAVSGISLADPLLPTTETVSVTLTATHGTLNMAAAAGVQITNNNSANVSVTGTLAAINAALATANSLVFTPAAAYGGAAAIGLVVTDSHSNTSNSSITVAVVGPLTVTSPGGQQLVSFGGSIGVAGLAINDPSLPGTSTVTVQFSATHGTLNLSTAFGLTTQQINNNGAANISVTAPLAAINATLAATGGLTFTAANGYNGPASVAVTADDPATNHATGSAQITVAGPLSATLPAGLQLVKIGGTLAVSGLGLSDPSLPASTPVTLVLTALNGTFNVSTTVSGGLGQSDVGGNGTTSVTLHGTLLAINNTLSAVGGITYTAGVGDGIDTVSVMANDGIGNTKSTSFSITAVGPLSATLPAGLQLVKTGGTLAVSGLGLSDPSLPASTPVTLVLTALNGTFNVSTTVSGGLGESDVGGNGTTSVTLHGTLLAINNTLSGIGGITYTAGVDDGIDTVSVMTNDGIGNTKSSSFSITVAGPIAVNPPESAHVVGTGGSLGIAGISVVDPSLPGDSLVTVTFAVQHGTLTLSTVPGGLQITNNSTNLVTATGTLAAINATLGAVNGLTYSSTSGFNGLETLKVTATDSATSSDEGDVAITVVGPIAISVPGAQATPTNGTLPISLLVINDPSIPPNEVVSVVLSVTHGTLDVSTTVVNGLGELGVTHNGTKSVTLSGTLIAINATLAAENGLVYTPDEDFNGSDSLAVSAHDNFNNSNSNSVSIAVGLTVMAPGAQTASAGHTLGINGISLSDPALANGDDITLELNSPNGVLTLSTTIPGGIDNTQITGQGGHTLTIVAPLSAINTTLAFANALAYTPALGFAGPDTLSISAHDDLGSENAAEVDIAVVGVPVVTAPQGTTLVKAGGSQVVSGLSVDNAFLPANNNMLVILSVAHGTLTLSTSVANGLGLGAINGNGTAQVTINAPLALINATLADAAGLTYTPTSGYTGPDAVGLSATNSIGGNGTGSAAIAVAGPITIGHAAELDVPSSGTHGVSGITISDLGLPSTGIVTIAFTVSHGTLNVSNQEGLQVNNNGSSSVTVSGALATLQSLLASSEGLTYSPTEGYNGNDALGIIATDAVGNTTTVSEPIVVGLTLNVPAAQVAPSGVALPLTGLSVFDPGLGESDTVSITFAVTHGTLSVSTSVNGGVDSQHVANNGTASVTLTGTVAQLNATLAAAGGLSYTSTAAYNGGDVLHVSATDTLENSNSANVNFLVVGPITIVPPSGAQNVKAGGTTVFHGISLSDVGLNAAQNVTVVFSALHGTLSISTTVQGGVNGQQVNGNGTASVTVSAPLANILATLADANDLTYTATASYTGPDTFTIAAHDIPGNSTTTNVQLNVFGPIGITVPQSPLVIKSSGSLPITGIVVTDTGLPATSTLTVSFSVTGGTLNLSTTVAGGIDGQHVSGDTTNSLTITGTLAAINATLADPNGLIYTPNGSFSGADTLTVASHDDAANSNSSPITINVIGPLAINNSTTTQFIPAGGSRAVTGLSLVDSGLPTTSLITLILSATNGTINLSTSVSGGLSLSQVTNNGSGQVTVSAPLAAINATLAASGGLTYQPTASFTGAATLGMTASDDPGNSANSSVSLNVVGPLSLTSAGSQTVKSGGTVAVSGYSLADTGLPTSSNVTLVFTASHGTINFSTTVANGLSTSQITGNGTASVTVIAPLAAINATLADANGLIYTATNGFSGSDNVSVSASDPAGNTASGQAAITIAPQNTASLSGTVYDDSNNNQVFDKHGLASDDPVAPGIVITLTGVDKHGAAVGPLVVQTDDNGSFTFKNLPGGTYTLTKSQPADLTDAPASLGSLGGSLAGNDVITGIVVTEGANGTGYNFGEGGLSWTLMSINLFLTTTPSGQELMNTYIANWNARTAANANIPVGVVSTIPGPAITLSTSPSIAGAGTAVGISGVVIADNFLLSSANNVQVTLAVQAGSLTVATAVSGGLTGSQIVGNGSGNVTLSGTLAAINATLSATNGLTYTAKSGFSGIDRYSVTANDLGNTLFGVAQTTVQSQLILVIGS